MTLVCRISLSYDYHPLGSVESLDSWDFEQMQLKILQPAFVVPDSPGHFCEEAGSFPEASQIGNMGFSVSLWPLDFSFLGCEKDSQPGVSKRPGVGGRG